MRTCASFALLASAAAHSSLISLKPRNAIGGLSLSLSTEYSDV